MSVTRASITALVSVAWIGLANVATAAPTITATVSPPLTLPDLISEAVRANLEIRAEETKIGQAKALYQYAAAQAYPSLRFGALFGGPTPEAKTQVINDPSSITAPSLQNDLDFGDLGVTLRVDAQGVQPLYTFGKISTGKEAAAHTIRAAKHNVHIKTGEVLVNVHRAYWALMLTSSYVSSLEDGEEILADILDKVEELIEEESAQVTENDRLRITHGLAALRVRLTESRVGRRMAMQALKLLIGREQLDDLAVAELDIEEVPKKLQPLSEAVAIARKERPEIRALGAVADAQDSFTELRMLALFPDIFIGGFIDIAYTSNATDQTNPFIYDPFNFFNAGIGIGLRAELDVFNKLAQAEQARAQLHTTVAQIEAVRQAIDLEVNTIHENLRGMYERLNDLERALIAARGWLTSSVLAYDIGTGDARELIDAFLARATSEGEYFKTCFDIQVALIDLERAVGLLQKRK